MKYIFFLILLPLFQSAFALDAGEFTLDGLDSHGRLIYFTPLVPEITDKGEPNGHFGKLRIDKFTDVHDIAVLSNCTWSKVPSFLDCNGVNKSSSRVYYEGFPLNMDAKSGEIIAPINAKKIQYELARHEACTRPDAYFVCKANCSSKMPKELLLVYCGD